MDTNNRTAQAEILTESINTMFRLGDDKFISLEFIGISEAERQQVIAALFTHVSLRRQMTPEQATGRVVGTVLLVEDALDQHSVVHNLSGADLIDARALINLENNS